MSTIWLIKLILSHLLADFVLQPRKWVNDRCTRHFLSPWLYLHTFIAAALALVFTGFQYWYFALVIFISHTLIDGWKSYRPQTVLYFLTDQLMHLLIIIACWYYTFYTITDVKEWLQATGSSDRFWLQNQYAAIGLLITAKGLLRFSEKDKQEEKTEYVLIGSLISFSISVITGIIVKYLAA